MTPVTLPSSPRVLRPSRVAHSHVSADRTPTAEHPPGMIDVVVVAGHAAGDFRRTARLGTTQHCHYRHHLTARNAHDIAVAATHRSSFCASGGPAGPRRAGAATQRQRPIAAEAATFERGWMFEREVPWQIKILGQQEALGSNFAVFRNEFHNFVRSLLASMIIQIKEVSCNDPDLDRDHLDRGRRNHPHE